MKFKKLDSGTVLIFDAGDEVVSTLTAFAKENHIGAAHFTAIGAFSDVGLGYFDLQKKDYLKNDVNEQVEVVSLIGDIALDKTGACPWERARSSQAASRHPPASWPSDCNLTRATASGARG
jgi:predicted DNA-binding protein with PD1-like motif